MRRIRSRRVTMSNSRTFKVIVTQLLGGMGGGTLPVAQGNQMTFGLANLVTTGQQSAWEQSFDQYSIRKIKIWTIPPISVTGPDFSSTTILYHHVPRDFHSITAPTSETQVLEYGNHKVTNLIQSADGGSGKINLAYFSPKVMQEYAASGSSTVLRPVRAGFFDIQDDAIEHFGWRYFFTSGNVGVWPIYVTAYITLKGQV